MASLLAVTSGSIYSAGFQPCQAKVFLVAGFVKGHLGASCLEYRCTQLALLSPLHLCCTVVASSYPPTRHWHPTTHPRPQLSRDGRAAGRAADAGGVPREAAGVGLGRAARFRGTERHRGLPVEASGRKGRPPTPPPLSSPPPLRPKTPGSGRGLAADTNVCLSEEVRVPGWVGAYGGSATFQQEPPLLHQGPLKTCRTPQPWSQMTRSGSNGRRQDMTGCSLARCAESWPRFRRRMEGSGSGWSNWEHLSLVARASWGPAPFDRTRAY
ncbi:hypothetical protein NDU88_007371 [Pleurodeles waltl]|uniref:Uncharacterized protein n=1 Tax=Pleurodeles waltl TaxID=8319 RepID=A0AAV7PLM9_PLEWA|nr:hypothetical protein NDU88_007371 [Pleurodeles waltl]